MYRIIGLFFLLGLSFNAYSQVVFEEGYFINNANEKIECLIKNIDWYNNPTGFIYKLSENNRGQEISISNIKEFSVGGNVKYVRAKVDIDRSSDELSKLSSSRAPSFKQEVLFLRELLSGNASLYAYQDGRLKRFFFKTDQQEKIIQLVFKSYKNKKGYVVNNVGYRQQLFNELKCNKITLHTVENLEYRIKDLTNFFIKYNECLGVDFERVEKKKRKDLFNLTPRLGINSGALTIDRESSFASQRTYIGYDREQSLRVGIETEFVLGFNKNKWAIIIEPTYEYYKTEIEVGVQKSKVDYTYFKLPAGVRHYMFLNNQSKIFVNAGFSLNFPINKEIEVSLNREFDAARSWEIHINKTSDIYLGLGYKYNDKFLAEFRYTTGGALLNDYQNWDADYKVMSFILGYTIF